MRVFVCGMLPLSFHPRSPQIFQIFELSLLLLTCIVSSLREFPHVFSVTTSSYFQIISMFSSYECSLAKHRSKAFVSGTRIIYDHILIKAEERT